jgi:hypothetical protein
VLTVDGGNAEALCGCGEILAERGEAGPALRDLDRLITADQPSAQTEAISGDPARAAELAERELNATDTPLSPHQRRAALDLLDSGGSGAHA